VRRDQDNKKNAQAGADKVGKAETLKRMRHMIYVCAHLRNLDMYICICAIKFTAPAHDPLLGR